MPFIVVHAHFPIFCTTVFFTFAKLKVFLKRLPLVCLSSQKQVYFQTGCHLSSHFCSYFPAYFSFLSSIWSESFLDTNLNIQPLFRINKLLSIDSFLDWEGHHWDISLIAHITPIALEPPPPVYQSRPSNASSSLLLIKC